MSEIIQCTEISQIPASGGSYAVLFSLQEEKLLQIGKLGLKTFSAGWYIYFGNAFGTGGLFSRISHHLRISEKPHWHIDWFRRAARPEVVYFTTSLTGLECKWRKIIETDLKGEVLVKGFGASDCRNNCGSHLLFFEMVPDENRLAENLLLPLDVEENFYLYSINQSKE